MTDISQPPQACKQISMDSCYFIGSLKALASGMTHEFNNILTGISGYCEMALEMQNNPEFSQRALIQSARAARKGAEFVKRIGYFARLGSPSYEVNTPLSVVKDMVYLFMAEVQHLGIRIHAEFAEIPAIRFDSSLLALAISSTLEAGRYALDPYQPGAPLISITTSLEGECATITIKIDAGPSELNLSCLSLTPFMDKKREHQSCQEISQFGLGIAQGLVENMGGTIEVSVPTRSQAFVRIQFPHCTSDSINTKHILVVDDELTIRTMFCRFLDKAGYTTDIAVNGEEALDRIRTTHYDMVFLDQMMPRMSGIQMLEALKNENLDLMPIVMITAGYSLDLAREALANGAVACTSKPINRAKILYLAGSYTGTYNAPALREADPVPEGVQLKVLIVEANELTREILEIILQRSGYQTCSAINGAQAIEEAEKDYYDMILLDMLVCDMPGIRIIQELRLRNPYTPILVTSQEISGSTLHEALRAGATRALNKRIEIEGILAEVNEMVRIFREQVRRKA